MVLYSQIKRNDYASHDDILFNMTKEIYGNKTDDRNILLCNEDDIIIVGVGKHFTIYLPENETLSDKQYNEVCNVIDLVDKFNKEKESNDRKDRMISIQLFGRTLTKENYSIDTMDTNTLKEFIKTQITNNPKKYIEKKIIGKKLSDNVIKNVK